VAQYTFGGGIADFVVNRDENGELLLGADTEIIFFNLQTGGTQYEGITVTSDSTGAIPPFTGPDGVREMWADANGGAGPRQLMTDTGVGPDLATVINDAADLDNAVAALQALAATMPINVLYDEGEAEWPARPDIAGSRIVFWHGPNASPPPSGYMSEVDVFFGWAA
jgi:hypothetical protein